MKFYLETFNATLHWIWLWVHKESFRRVVECVSIARIGKCWMKRYIFLLQTLGTHPLAQEGPEEFSIIYCPQMWRSTWPIILLSSFQSRNVGGGRQWYKTSCHFSNIQLFPPIQHHKFQQRFVATTSTTASSSSPWRSFFWSQVSTVLWIIDRAPLKTFTGRWSHLLCYCLQDFHWHWHYWIGPNNCISTCICHCRKSIPWVFLSPSEPLPSSSPTSIVQLHLLLPAPAHRKTTQSSFIHQASRQLTKLTVIAKLDDHTLQTSVLIDKCLLLQAFAYDTSVTLPHFPCTSHASFNTSLLCSFLPHSSIIPLCFGRHDFVQPFTLASLIWLPQASTSPSV